MRLDPARFDDWFRALNGLPADQGPFPWQRRLFRHWLCPPDSDQARWPRWLELPTASGKTALIDLAVLALAAGSPCARRRIAFIVDRRVVVDEAARRAGAIAERLKRALEDSDSPLREVAEALLALGGEEPLLVATLRGGIPSDDRWARSPAQPSVILSTVDQVGSRLLFRSYGDAGPRAWPIHAGLLGRDALLLVDEAHCARPFCQTVDLIRGKWQHFAETPVGEPVETVFLSATLGETADFRLQEEDHVHPVLRRRLEVSKLVELVLEAGSRKAGRDALVEAIRSRTERTLKAMRAGVLGIIVNRVRDARAIYEALPLDPSRKLLLTGKARPWERDRLLERWLPHLEAGARERPEEPVAVVATQCVEVGANLDFDFLVTEIAPLDALRQRFGRLDRLGDRGGRLEQIGAIDWPCGAIVALTSQVERDSEGAPKNPDPVYGAALCHTWHWLAEQASGQPPRVDFGIAQLQARLPAGEALARLCHPVRQAYRLLPAHLDLLVQTSPPPEPDPEIGAFLHGVTQAGPDVTIVWRADLAEDNVDGWVDRVAVQPPAPGEGCTVPIWEFRQWMSLKPGQAEVDGGDLEAVLASGEAVGAGRKLLRWRGPSESEVVPVSGIRPGDVVVVPAAYGGCDAFGWHPASNAPVLDIGDAAAFTAGRRAVLRLDAVDGHLEGIPTASEARDLIEELRRWASGEQEAPDPAGSLGRLAGMKPLPEWLRQLAARLAADGRRRAVGSDGSFAIVGCRSRGEDFTTAAETSLAAAPVGLAEHCRGVEEWAKRFAALLGIPEAVASDLAAAAWLHDVGKADPRFQAWLHGGDEIAANLADQPFAKSALNARDWRVLKRARQLARYPEGARHEVQSVAMIASEQTLRDRAHDWELVSHLIVSHHGFARPFVPVTVDLDPVEIELHHDGVSLRGRSDHHLERLDSGIAERFWALVRRYGWWGLAYLEAILRLADHRRSEEEETSEGNQGGR
jgi:CRISPR-associated endonuclease/helicase Cas3